MEVPRYRLSHQSVCRQCSTAKTRCSRGFHGTGCARCGKRGLACSLAHTKGNSTGSGHQQEHAAAKTYSNAASQGGDAALQPVGHPSHGSPEAPAPLEDANVPACSAFADAAKRVRLDFSSLDLTCPIDADGISNRWLNPYIPAPGQKAKAYDTTVTSFIHRNLMVYASIAVHGRGIPPFIHPAQLNDGGDSSLLSTCLIHIRLFERFRPGDPTATDVIKQEMAKIFEQRHTFSTMTSLAAYQAYMLYSLVLCFWPVHDPDDSMVQAMMHLQEFASITAKQGIVCLAESQRTRPKWEEWVVAEAKRRTIYVMYLFDGLLSARDGLPSFLGTELQGLYAPASQSLWFADNREDWERKYDAFCSQWPEGYLTIDELWPAPPDHDVNALARRQARVDQWLEDVDKYGTMLYAVTSYIHKN